MSDKFGFPSKKKTMIARGRKFSGGGDLLAQTKASLARKEAGIKDVPEPSYWDSVKDVVKRAVTPKVAETMRSHTEKTKRAIDMAGGQDVQEPVEGKKKGGMVKAKPRGVGCAQRGHGKVGRQ